MILEYYRTEVPLTPDMADLVAVAEPMIDALKRVRLYQVMQARLRGIDGEDRP